MCDAEPILSTHPSADANALVLVARVLRRLDECVQVSQICADACLAADEVASLRMCIRLNLDCAAVCAAGAAVVGRLVAPDGAVLRAVLDACVAACEACATECRRHAAHHDHCRICAETCAAGTDATQAMLKALTA